jgi:protein-S-isoprenylcysteine O-methyltransferase Ste14
MKLYEHIERTGNWLFSRRSYFPFLIVPLLLIALRDSEQIEQHFGNCTQVIWEAICIAISFSGFIVRVLTVGWIAEGTSGRNTKAQLAESLNTDGAYSMVRHPLYLGNFLVVLGGGLFVQVWWFVVILILSFLLFYERIIFAEESFLDRKFGVSYREWVRQRPIFFPNLKKWKKPKNNFSWKMVLRKEYTTFFGINVGFFLIKLFAELIGEGHFELRMPWLIYLGIVFSFYLTLRTIRKKTQWLQ